MAKNYGNKVGGNMDMSSLLKKAQKIQEDMQKTQEQLEKQEVEGSAGGGVIKVKANGRKKILSVQIDPKILDPEDVEEVEDLIKAAVNHALDNADKLSEDEVSKVMPSLPSGFKIPGF